MVVKSVKLNAVLNVIKSLLSVVFPLITYPYATRVLGVENIGKVSYGSSIITYFSLIAAFGITSYAIREGSKVRDKKCVFDKLASDLFSLNIYTTIVSYALLAILLALVNKLENYRLLIALQSITIIFTTLGVDWVNVVFEDYLYTTVRGIVTNILSMVALFIFVKNSNDYYIYAMLTVLVNAITCILNFFYCKKYVHIKMSFSLHSMHLKKMSVFFVNAVAISIYVSSDTTMLGWMVNDYSVGIYSVAVKIYSIMKLVLASIYSVALPRLSYYISHNNTAEFKRLITKIVSAIIVLLLPIVAGIIMLSNEIVIIIGGPSFADAGLTLKILSIALLFAILGGILTQCINISLGMEKTNAQATIISAIVNILLNIPFITFLHENGAAITTALAEFTVLLFCVIKGKNTMERYDCQSLKTNLVHSLLGVVIVISTSIIIHTLFSGIWSVLILTLLISVSFYSLMLIILKNELACEIIAKILKVAKVAK